MRRMMMTLQQKAAAKMMSVASKFSKDQRGELPYWVNVLMVIVIIVVLGIAVYASLSSTIKTQISNYVNDIFSSII